MLLAQKKELVQVFGFQTAYSVFLAAGLILDEVYYTAVLYADEQHYFSASNLLLESNTRS